MQSMLEKGCTRAVAVLAVVLTSAGVAFAGTPVGVPEVDGSTLTTALGVATAGVLIVRSWRRSR